MHAASISLGGGVSPRNARLRGQSTIEYVLIAAVIGLVVVFAGPWIASAIRNQFNAVTETLGEGTTENAFRDPVDISDPQHGTAFAVYSADDNSLMFYKRRGVPKVGDMFNDRRVTEVYTGFETEHYVPTSDDWNGTVNTPWYGHATDCTSVCVVDYGIHPSHLEYWFHRFDRCASFDVEKLDTSLVTSIAHAFSFCRSVKTLDLSLWDLSRITGAVSSFSACTNLESVSFGELPFSNLEHLDWMFNSCSNLKLDCSDWNVKPSSSHKDFSGYSPGVIMPRAWQ